MALFKTIDAGSFPGELGAGIPVQEAGSLAQSKRIKESSALSIVDPLENGEWDSLVAHCPEHTVFHASAWAHVLRDTYQHYPLYLHWTGQTPSSFGLLPLMEINTFLKGKRAIALPFTDACPPLTTSSEAAAALFNAAQALGRKRGWKSLEIRGSIASLPSVPPSTTFYQHTLDLTLGEKVLFENLDPSVRRAIRKAQKENVRIVMDRSMSAMRQYFDLHVLTRHKHGLPPQPFEFFEHIQQRFLAAGHGFVTTAFSDTIPVAAAVFLTANQKAVYKFGASNEKLLHLRANNLVMWEAIRHLASRGFQTLDFGRTSLGHDGLRRFKLGWGALEKNLSYYCFDFATGSFVSRPDRASGWHNNLFRMLPLPLLKGLGRFLYPHLG